MDMADVKPTVLSWLVVTLMSITGIVLMKWLMAKYPVPGIADIVGAV